MAMTKLRTPSYSFKITKRPKRDIWKSEKSSRLSRVPQLRLQIRKRNKMLNTFVMTNQLSNKMTIIKNPLLWISTLISLKRKITSSWTSCKCMAPTSSRTKKRKNKQQWKRSTSRRIRPEQWLQLRKCPSFMPNMINRYKINEISVETSLKEIKRPRIPNRIRNIKFIALKSIAKYIIVIDHKLIHHNIDLIKVFKNT